MKYIKSHGGSKPYSRMPRLEFPRSVVASLWAPVVATPESKARPVVSGSSSASRPWAPHML